MERAALHLANEPVEPHRNAAAAAHRVGVDSWGRHMCANEAAVNVEAARVIWLNPLLGNASYRPVARTMRAALAHVSVFASAHNLESLQALGRSLSL